VSDGAYPESAGVAQVISEDRATASLYVAPNMPADCAEHLHTIPYRTIHQMNGDIRGSVTDRTRDGTDARREDGLRSGAKHAQKKRRLGVGDGDVRVGGAGVVGAHDLARAVGVRVEGEDDLPARSTGGARGRGQTNRE